MADINLLGLVGNQTYANPLDPAQYDEIKAQQDALLQSYINRPTGPTLGQGLATALAAALPAALGGIVGGKEGLGYGLTAGSAAAKTSLDQIAQANEQQAEGNLLEYMRNRQGLMGADAYKANVLDRQNKIDDAVTIAKKLKSPQGIETLGQIEVEKAKPRSFLMGDRPASDLEIDAVAAATKKPREQLEGMSQREVKSIKDLAETERRQKTQDSQLSPAAGQAWLPDATPSEKDRTAVTKINEKFADFSKAYEILGKKLQDVKGKSSALLTANDYSDLQNAFTDAATARKKLAETGMNTTDNEMERFIARGLPDIWQNNMSGYKSYLEKTFRGTDPIHQTYNALYAQRQIVDQRKAAYGQGPAKPRLSESEFLNVLKEQKKTATAAEILALKAKGIIE